MVDDVRFIEINSSSGFPQTGNYMLTAERLNAALERVEAPFRIAGETLEFDIIRS